MRILLAHPPLNPAGEVTPPLGLCTIASRLLHLDHEVRVIDLDLEIKHPSVATSQSYLDMFASEMKNFAPQAVGITSMYNNSLQAERLMRVAKRCDPSAVVVAGGAHFGAMGRRSLERIPELDFVVEGEGEQAFAALLDALEHDAPVSEIPRLGYRVDGDVRINHGGDLLDLSDLPPMWTTLEGCIDLERYARTIPEESARRAIYIEAGRGCPFACTFCATAPFWQRKYRVKPVDRIVDEIRFLHEQFGYDSFMLVHDLLTVDKKFIFEFSDAMLDARLSIEWMANHRTDLKLRGLLPKIKAAGCWKMFFGIESASARMQKEVHKGLKMEEAVSTIKELEEIGISATCSFIIGFPTESTAELSETIKMGAQLKLHGVETVQLHRLRTWPPAPLSSSQLPAQFDLDSLRIEYPFLEVPEEDITAIAADAEFFAGYFAPHSEAGSFTQLAQVEMFFDFAIAMTPFTIAAIARFTGAQLVDSFYRTLSESGGISRDALEWSGLNLYRNWLAVYPLLNTWISKQARLADWQRVILCGLIDYERQRLLFVSNHAREDTLLMIGENWIAFEVAVDISRLLERLTANEELTPDLLTSQVIVLVRKDNNSFDAYTLSDSLKQDLLQRSPDLLSVFSY